MNRPRLQIDCRSRLAQMADEWGIPSSDASPPLPPLSRPSGRPTFRVSPRDDLLAMELLRRRRLEQQAASGGQANGASSSGIGRAFTTSRGAKKDKPYEAREMLDAVGAHVAAGGSAGVAEALLMQLEAAGGGGLFTGGGGGGGGSLNGGGPSQSHRNSLHGGARSLLSRRRSVDFAARDRSAILRSAVASGSCELVSLLAPFADPAALDSALPLAVRAHDLAATETLLRHGASLAANPAAQEAFREACAHGGRCDMVALLVRGTEGGMGNLPPEVASRGLADAAAAGCLDTVLALARSRGADADFDGAAPLKAAVRSCRRDVALALVWSAHRPPLPANAPGRRLAAMNGSPAAVATTCGLDDAFALFTALGHQYHPLERLAMAELLLCAGASGSPVADALVAATQADNIELAGLLVRYGASLEGHDGLALRKAVSGGRTDLVAALLASPAPLSPLYASECVELMPKRVSNAERRLLLDAMLRRGAAGDALSAALVDAVEAGDAESVKLLLLPHFPGESGRPVGGYGDDDDGPSGDGATPSRGQPASRSMVFERHEVASVDYRNGQALQVAASAGDVEMARLILSHSRPAPATLAAVFPVALGNAHVVATTTTSATRGSPSSPTPAPAPQHSRLGLVAALLAAGLDGPVVDRALEQAVLERPPARDDALIALLLGGAKVNYNGGAALLAAASQGDVPLLTELLKKRPAPEVVARAVPVAVDIKDSSVRGQVLALLLGTGVQVDPAEVSKAAVAIFNAEPVDKDLLRLLLGRGKADVNFANGLLFEQAVLDPDVALLALLLSTTRATASSVDRGFRTLTKLSGSDASKAGKLSCLLSHHRPRATLSTLLVTEVIAAVKSPAGSRSLSITRALLQAGADPGELNGTAVCEAVRAADAQLTDLLLSGVGGDDDDGVSPNPDLQQQPRRVALNPAARASALRAALTIPDPMDRLAFAKRVLRLGVAPLDVNYALCLAIDDASADEFLLRLLVPHADARDGQALATAIHVARPDAAQAVLAHCRYPPSLLDQAVGRAAQLPRERRAERLELVRALLAAGATGRETAGALVAASREGDLELARALMPVEGADGEEVVAREESGGGIGMAIVDAAGAGRPDVLKMLLGAGHNGDDDASAGSGGEAKGKGKGKGTVNGGTTPSNRRRAVPRQVLLQAWQAATRVGDLSVRADVLGVLLARDAGAFRGDPLDQQLVSAVKFGAEGEALAGLLLDFGASPDFNGGDAVWNAARAGRVDALRTLLGVADGEERDESKPPLAPTTLVRAFKAAMKLSGPPRRDAISLLFAAGMPVREDVHVALNEAVNEEVVDTAVIELLLSHGASPLTNCCRTLIDAAKRLMLPVVAEFLRRDVSQKDASWVFVQAVAADNADAWLTPDGLRLVEALLEKGATGDGPGAALACVLEQRGGRVDEALHEQFLDVLLLHHADVSYSDGLVLRRACERSDAALVRRMMDCQPTPHAVSMAFPYIFQPGLDEDGAMDLIDLFSSYSSGDQRFESIPTHPDFEPPLFRALAQFPRSTRILKALLDLGYYHDQVTTMAVRGDEEEEVTALLWAILQPQKKVSGAVIMTLIERRANVNFATATTQTTPLMAAIRAQRLDVVEALLAHGAEADVSDVDEDTPLSMATRVGGEKAIKLMHALLSSDVSPPRRDDGSLHNAARELNLRAIRLLVDVGRHDPDFPSTRHGGRSALGELCLNAARGDGDDDDGAATPLSATMQKDMERAIDFLTGPARSDIAVRDAAGKSALHLAMESADPVTTTRILLKAGMWKHLAEDFNTFTDARGFVYSPTAYVARVMALPLSSSSPSNAIVVVNAADPAAPPPNPASGPAAGTTPEASHVRASLLQLLRANRARDVYYSTSPAAPQPADAVGVPDHLLEAERARRARADRRAALEQDHALQLRRDREAAEHQVALQAHVHGAELVRRSQAHELGLSHMAGVATAEARAAAARDARERDHARLVADDALARRIAMDEADAEAERARNARALEMARALNRERMADAKAASRLRIEEREQVDRFDRAHDGRVKERLRDQKRLMDSRSELADRFIAASMAHGGQAVNQRQIGYVMGETE